LIHTERTFDENVYTLRSRYLHEKVDQAGHDVRDGVRIEYAMPLWSDRLGLIGKADVVEFHAATPYPVEFKVGRQRSGGAVLVQLCAQAIMTQGTLLQPDHDTIKVKVEGQVNIQVPLLHLSGICCFGRVVPSIGLIHRCAMDGRAMVFFDAHGRFRARLPHAPEAPCPQRLRQAASPRSPLGARQAQRQL
jgi:hypothetical protein